MKARSSKILPPHLPRPFKTESLPSNVADLSFQSVPKPWFSSPSTLARYPPIQSLLRDDQWAAKKFAKRAGGAEKTARVSVTSSISILPPKDGSFGGKGKALNLKRDISLALLALTANASHLGRFCRPFVFFSCPYLSSVIRSGAHFLASRRLFCMPGHSLLSPGTEIALC